VYAPGYLIVVPPNPHCVASVEDNLSAEAVGVGRVVRSVEVDSSERLPSCFRAITFPAVMFVAALYSRSPSKASAVV